MQTDTILFAPSLAGAHCVDQSSSGQSGVRDLLVRAGLHWTEIRDSSEYIEGSASVQHAACQHRSPISKPRRTDNIHVT